MSRTLERSYRVYLRIFPQSWRNEHGAVVLGMLLDEAEAQGRTRIPIKQRLTLIMQGLAEHYSYRTVRILAAIATGLWVVSMVIALFPSLASGIMLESTGLTPAGIASIETARSAVGFALPHLLTVLALSGFLYRVGWLGAGLRLLINLFTMAGLVVASLSMWNIVFQIVRDFDQPVIEEAASSGAEVAAWLALMLAVPLLLVVGLGIRAVRMRSGKLLPILLAIFLVLCFGQLIFLGGGLIQVLAPILVVATILQEKRPARWLESPVSEHEDSRPRFIEWTQG